MCRSNTPQNYHQHHLCAPTSSPESQQNAQNKHAHHTPAPHPQLLARHACLVRVKACDLVRPKNVEVMT
jgi:hypothetical protein